MNMTNIEEYDSFVAYMEKEIKYLEESLTQCKFMSSPWLRLSQAVFERKESLRVFQSYFHKE